MSGLVSFWYVAGKQEGMKAGQVLSKHDNIQGAIEAANLLLHDKSYLYLKIGKEYTT